MHSNTSSFCFAAVQTTMICMDSNLVDLTSSVEMGDLSRLRRVRRFQCGRSASRYAEVCKPFGAHACITNSQQAAQLLFCFPVAGLSLYDPQRDGSYPGKCHSTAYHHKSRRCATHHLPCVSAHKSASCTQSQATSIGLNRGFRGTEQLVTSPASR